MESETVAMLVLCSFDFPPSGIISSAGVAIEKLMGTVFARHAILFNKRVPLASECLDLCLHPIFEVATRENIDIRKSRCSKIIGDARALAATDY
jgi:hypothetical protein